MDTSGGYQAVTLSVQLIQVMECTRGNSWCQYTSGLPFTDIRSPWL